MVVIIAIYHGGLQRGDYIHAARSQCALNPSPESLRQDRGGLSRMVLLGAIVFVLKSIGFRLISDDVSFNLISIGVIIGKRCMDLRK